MKLASVLLVIVVILPCANVVAQSPPAELKPRAVLAGHGSEVAAIAFSADGRVLASGDTDEQILLWDLKTGRRLANLKGKTKPGGTTFMWGLAFSPHGNVLAGAGGMEPEWARLWSVATKRVRAELPMSGRLGEAQSVAFSPDGSLFTTGGDDKAVRLWAVGTGKVVAVLKGHTDIVTWVRFSPDGKTLASSSWDGTIRLWNVADRRLRATLRGHSKVVRYIEFLGDGGLLVSASNDWTVRVWDVGTGRERRKLASEQEDVWDLAVASSGERFAVCSFGGVVREWRTADGQALATIAADVGSPSYSPDGRLLAIRGRRGLEVYAATTGKLLAIGKTPSTAYQTSFSRDGKTIVTFGVDSKIRLWDVPALAP